MPDYKKWSAALDSVNVIYDEKGEHSTRLMQLRPVRQDAGNNTFEMRPEFGDITGQGDFSGGAGQTFFHRSFRDERMYLYSRGLAIDGIYGGVVNSAGTDQLTTANPGSFCAAVVEMETAWR